MAKVIACIIARTVSKRLPKKVLKEIYQEYSMLDFIIQRIKNCKKINKVYICTSSDKSDDILENIAKKNNVSIYRGSKSKVIERMIKVGEINDADYLIRITGDNVFTSYEYIDRQIEIIEQNKLDYVRLHKVPIGATAEVISYSALQDCYIHMDPSISEYLMLYIFNPKKYKCGLLIPVKKDYSNYTLTVDTENDYNRTLEIFDKSKVNDKLNIKLKDIITTIKLNNIKYSKYSFDGLVKYPYGKIISFKEYKSDMEEKINSSSKFFL